MLLKIVGVPLALWVILGQAEAVIPQKMRELRTVVDDKVRECNRIIGNGRDPFTCEVELVQAAMQITTAKEGGPAWFNVGENCEKVTHNRFSKPKMKCYHAMEDATWFVSFFVEIPAFNKATGKRIQA